MIKVVSTISALKGVNIKNDDGLQPKTTLRMHLLSHLERVNDHNQFVIIVFFWVPQLSRG